MALSSILTVPVANLSAAALELAFSNLETAKLLAEIESVRPRSTTQDAGSVLAEEAKLKRLRDREPWQTAIENAAAERTDISLQTQLEQRELFVALAKAHALTPEDTMALTYSLYGSAETAKIYAHLVMRKTGLARIVAHNFFVASQRTDAQAFGHAEGALLLTLPLPLFPPMPEFAAQTATLLREYSLWYTQHGGGSPQVASGGGSPQFHSTQYARGSHTGDAYGGGTLALQQDGQGAWVVDTTPIEHAFDALWQQVQGLKEETAKLAVIKHTTEAKTIADAIVARLSSVSEGLGKARGAARFAATGRGGRPGRGRGRGGRSAGF